VVASIAYDRASSLGWSEIAVMTPEAQLDLTLPHLAEHGEWVGRDRPSARGPLWQATLASVVGGDGDPAKAVFARGLVFPLVALGFAAFLAARASRRRWVRFAVGVPALGWAIFEPEAAWRLSVLLGVTLLYPRVEDGEVRASQRGVWAAAPVAIAGGFAPSILVEGAFAFTAASIVGASWVGARVAAERLAGACLTLAGAAAVLVTFAWPDPWLPWAALRWPLAVVGGEWEWAALTATFAFACAWARARGLVWLAAMVPLVVFAALEGALSSVAAPLASSMLLVAVSIARARRLLALTGLLLVCTAMLGRAGQLGRALTGAVGGASGADRAVAHEGDGERARAALEGRGGCVVAPASLAVAWASAGARGPLEAPLDRDRWAREIRARECPWALVTLPTFDSPYADGVAGFDAAGLALAELYRPVERLGPALFLAARDAPRRPRRRILRPAPPLPRQVTLRAGERARFELERPVRADHLLELAIGLTPVGAPTGRPEVLLLRGEEMLRAPLVLPVPDHGGRVRVPIDAELAEHRWRLGAAGAADSGADALVLRYEGEGAWQVRLTGVIELSPPPATQRAVAATTSLPVALLEQPSWARFTAPRRDGADVVLESNPPGLPPAELFVEVTGGEGACLVGEVGLESPSSSGARLQIDVVDGPARHPRVDWAIARGWRRPFVLSLPPHRVLVRIGVTSEEGGVRTRLHRPRLEACGARRSVVHALHDGQHDVVRGAPTVTGDTLALPALARGAPPVDVRLTHTVQGGDCLSLEMRGRTERGPVAVGVGVVHRGRLHRLAREVFWPDDQRPQRAFRDLPLGEWVGQEVALRFAAWPMERETRGGVGEIVRPQIHACGERPTWHF